MGGLTSLSSPIDREETLLERSHFAFLRRLGVVPAADVERPVRHEEAKLIGRGPADVTCLATATFGCLRRGPLDRHDAVAEVRPTAGRTGEPRRVDRAKGRAAIRVSGMGRKGLGWQQRKRQDVGRSLDTKVSEIQLGQLGVIGQDQPDRGG
jgi:hypothetical protein